MKTIESNITHVFAKVESKNVRINEFITDLEFEVDKLKKRGGKDIRLTADDLGAFGMRVKLIGKK